MIFGLDRRDVVRGRGLSPSIRRMMGSMRTSSSFGIVDSGAGSTGAEAPGRFALLEKALSFEGGVGGRVLEKMLL